MRISRIPFVSKAIDRLDRRYALRQDVDALNSRSVRVGASTAADFDAYSELCRLLRVPPSAHDWIRLGPEADGGYVVAGDLLKGGGRVLSIGVGTEAGADLALARRGYQVFQFDHTISHQPVAHPLISWTPLGLARRNAPGSACRSLADLAALAGIGEGGDALLLIDVEGAEWDVLEDPELDLSPFSQVVMELHGLDLVLDPDYSHFVLQGIRNLTSTHVPLVVHANNFAPALSLGGSVLPFVLEVTLVRRDLLHLGNEGVPDHLLAANTTDRRELPNDLVLIEPTLSGMATHGWPAVRFFL